MHPAVLAFEALCAKAEELGIDLTFRHHGVVPMMYGGLEIQIEDIEGRDCSEFPPICEVKFTFESQDTIEVSDD